MDIYLDASRLGIYPPLFTSPSGNSCILTAAVLVDCLAGEDVEDQKEKACFKTESDDENSVSDFLVPLLEAYLRP